MNHQSFDVIVAKDYEIQKDGNAVKKTAWNRVGRAWKSRSSDALNFELFLIPNQRYVIQLEASKTAQSQTLQNTALEKEFF